MQHVITVEGRSLIRTFLAGATNDAVISSKVLSKLSRKKNKIYLANPKEKTIFAPDDESLKRLVAHRRVFILASRW